MGLEILPLLSHHATLIGLSFASAPLFFHDVGCVCASVSEKFMKVWCNVSVVLLETIRRDYARCLTFLRHLFVDNSLGFSTLFRTHDRGLGDVLQRNAAGIFVGLL